MSEALEVLDPMGWVKWVSESEPDRKAAEKVARRKTSGELRRLTQFMERGGQLVREDVEGLGPIYRSRARAAAPFSPEIVARWCEREGKSLPDSQ